MQLSMFEEGERRKERRYRGTLDQARDRVFANLDNGSFCPCCGQFCKLYKRKLNSGMSAALIWIVRRYERERDWINVPRDAPRFVLRTKEYGTTRHWGLLMQKPHDPEDDDGQTKTSGLWKPTEKGIRFVHNRISIPKRVHLYNNQVLGWSEERITIEEALGSPFNYAELMSRGEE